MAGSFVWMYNSNDKKLFICFSSETQQKHNQFFP